MRSQKIRSLSDFIGIPEEELAACLRAFRQWLETQKGFKADAESEGRKYVVPEAFEWRPKEAGKKAVLAVTPTTSIRDLGLKPAAVFACMEERIYALEDFSAVEEWELRKTPNIGQATVAQVRELLLSVGLNFSEPKNPQRRVWERAKAVRGGQALPEVTDQDHVVELDLNSVTLGRLMAKGINTVGELRRTKPRDLGMLFGVAGGQHTIAKLRARGLDLEPPPKQLEMWRYQLVPLSQLDRPKETDSVEELRPWLGALPSAARRAGIETVGDLRQLVNRGPVKVRGIGEYGWRRLAEYFGAPISARSNQVAEHRPGLRDASRARREVAR